MLYASGARRGRAHEWAFVTLILSAFLLLTSGLAGALDFTTGSATLVPSLVLSGVFLLVLLFVGQKALLPGARSRSWTIGAPLVVALAWLPAILWDGWWAVAPGAAALLAVGWLLSLGEGLPRGADANLWGWFFVLPAVLLLIVWQFAPAAYALYLSFFDNVNFIRQARFSGFENFVALLRDPLFWHSLLNSAWYVLGTVPTGIAIATVIAILLNEKVAAVGFWRTLFFLPYITALTAAAAVWKWIYNPEFGILNALFGTRGQDWLNNSNGLIQLLVDPLHLHLPLALQGPSVALTAVMVMSVWHQLGYSVVILLAGLQTIPREYYEAASLDGASWWQQVRFITWPLLSPTTFFLMVTGLIFAFQVFTQILVMTPDGVLNTTTTIVKYLYDKGFRDSNFSYASAMAAALFLIVFAFTLIQNKVLSRRVHYDL